MTADEIRAIVQNIDKNAGISPHDLLWIEALIEIAAQLAELNQQLRDVTKTANPLGGYASTVAAIRVQRI